MEIEKSGAFLEKMWSCARLVCLYACRGVFSIGAKIISTTANFSLMVLVLLLSSCSQNKPTPEQLNIGRDKIYKGQLNIDADASLESIMKQQLEVFQYLNDSINIHVAYKHETEMLDDLINRKAGVLVLCRNLSKQEQDNLKTRDTLYVREVKIAYDAVALIGNLKFNDSKLDMNALKEYFDPANKSAVLPRMVFDDKGSSAVNYVLNLLGYNGQVSSRVSAVKSPLEVIDYVAGNDNAIGFIPFNFISDESEHRVKEIFKRIKVLSLRTKNQEAKEIRVSANQSDIVTGDYPLIRTIHTEMRYSFEDSNEWNFVNFLFKEKGQRIFLRAGLIPATMPQRDIEVNTDGLKRSN